MRKVLIFILFMTILTGCNLSSSSNAEAEESPIITNTPIDLDLESESADEVEENQLLPTRTPQPTALPDPNAPPPTSVDNTNNTTTTTVTAQQVDPTAIPQQASAPIFSPVSGGQRVFGVNVDDTGSISGSGITLFDIGTRHFSQNPVNSDTYAVIDQLGMFYIRRPQGDFRVEQGPYTQFPATSLETNNSPAVMSTWSQNGQNLAFLVDPAQEASAGLWWFEPGNFAPIQLIVDCPFEGYRGCMIVQPGADNLIRWESLFVEWAPNNTQMLVTLNLPTEGRQGILITEATRNERVRDQRPEIWFYDYGSWGVDGRILTSGRNPQGAINVAWINPDGSRSEQIFAASSNGLWMGWAVQRPSGDIVALGAQGSGGTPVAIYDMNGNALTDLIGTAFPDRVVWNADRSAVIVEAGGRQYVATVNGQVVEITAQSTGYSVNWVN